MNTDERAWLGDPAAPKRAENVRGSPAALAAAVHGARPFPAAAAKILALTSGQDFDVGAIATALEGDLALSTRILRIVNSASFGMRARCMSIKAAVPLLGIEGVRRSVIAGSVLHLFPGAGTAVWCELHEHAGLVGGLARHLAPEWHLPPDEMFTAAFLHDIGKWVLLETEADYENVLADGEGHVDGTLDEERGGFGFDHAELGEHLLRGWKIPAPIPRIVGLHHDPANAYTDDGQLARKVALVRVADRLAHCMRSTTELPDFDDLATGEPFSYLGLTPRDVGDRYEALRQLFRSEDADDRPVQTSPPRATSAPSDARPDESPAKRTTKPLSAATPTTEACEHCTGASFGGRCASCGARICGAHTSERGACPTCADRIFRESRPYLRAVLVAGLFTSELIGTIILGANHDGAWAALPLVLAVATIPVAALSPWLKTTTTRRLGQ